MEQLTFAQLCVDIGSGYSNVQPLGEGGMGTLYRAHKDSLDVDVVIKCVKQKFKGRMDERAEANILKTLKHKYLPRIYDIIDSPSGYIYTVMDLIDGVNLQKYIETHGPVNQKLAYRWACQLSEVIAYLHAQEPPILHCDVKPSNIMITPSGDICLIDFNTSLVFSDGMVALGATPGYAAPEQYTRRIITNPVYSDEGETLPLGAVYPGAARSYSQKGRSTMQQNYRGTPASSLTVAQATSAGGYGTVSKRTDVYGIDATLYYALTGEKPNHSLKEVRPITAYKLKISRSFQQIILCSMNKLQEDRFADAQSMLNALHSVGTADRRYKSAVRTQWAVGIVSVVLICSGGITIALGVNKIHQENDAAYDSEVRRGRTAAEEMRFEDAQEYLKQAIEIYDDRLEAYAEQTVLLYRQGLYAECIDAVNSIFVRPLNCDDQQEWANVCYVAANSYYELGEYENAAQWYKKAIEYSPTVEAYYRDCAIAYARAGNDDAVQQVLKQMSSNFPQVEQSADYCLILSQLALQQGDNQQAVEQALQAINTAQEEQLLCRAYVLAAEAYEPLGSDYIDEEISLLERGMDELSGGYYNMAASYLGMSYASRANLTGNTSDLENALEVYQSMQKNGRNTFAVGMNIALLQQKLKLYTDAEETLLQLKQDYPNDYRVFKQLSYLELERENARSSPNYAQAKIYYQQAVHLYALAQAQGTVDTEMEQLEEWINKLTS